MQKKQFSTFIKIHLKIKIKLLLLQHFAEKESGVLILHLHVILTIG